MIGGGGSPCGSCLPQRVLCARPRRALRPSGERAGSSPAICAIPRRETLCAGRRALHAGHQAQPHQRRLLLARFGPRRRLCPPAHPLRRSLGARCPWRPQRPDLPPPPSCLCSNRAFAQLRSEAFGSALADATAALELDPSYAKALYRRGDAAFALGHLRDAVRDFRAAARLAPQDPDLRRKVRKAAAVLAWGGRQCGAGAPGLGPWVVGLGLGGVVAGACGVQSCGAGQAMLCGGLRCVLPASQPASQPWRGQHLATTLPAPDMACSRVCSWPRPNASSSAFGSRRRSRPLRKAAPSTRLCSMTCTWMTRTMGRAWTVSWAAAPACCTRSPCCVSCVLCEPDCCVCCAVCRAVCSVCELVGEYASHRTTPHHTTPHRTAPHHTTPHHTTPHHTTPHHTTPHRTTPHRTAPHRTAPHCTTPHHTAPHVRRRRCGRLPADAPLRD